MNNKVITSLQIERVNPDDLYWQVWSPTGIKLFDFLSLSGVSSELRLNIRKTLSWYVSYRSAHHAHNIYKYLKEFFDSVYVADDGEIDSITNIHLINYRDSLGEEREYRLSTLSGFLKRWHGFGHPGVDASAIDYLRRVRLSGNRKGEAVLTMDPQSGPFTDLEFEAIHVSLTEAFYNGDMNLEDYLATRLFMLLGSRPKQIALLKTCDLSVAENPDGTKSYSLEVPRAKQPGVSPRGEMRTRPLISDIGALLVQHASTMRASFEARGLDPDQAPMFALREPSELAPTGLEWHIGSAALGVRVVQAFAKIAPLSERTGEPIHMTPTRFRRTLATRAASEGHGELIIADMLDHTDIQNVRVYVELRPEIVKRIDRALAFKMAPIAQAFAGVVVSDDDGARPRITDPRFDPTKPVGSCGQHSHCAFSAPIACYTCGRFNAWVDGPHEAVLEHLLGEEERLSKTVDDRIATINRRTILAVAQVVQLCSERLRSAHG